MKTRIIGAIFAMAMLSMTGMAAADVVDDGMIDPVASNIIMKATPNSITIMNLGTAPRDVGGFQLIVKEDSGLGSYIGMDVAILPYIKVLVGNPYPEAVDGVDEVQPGYFKFAVTVPTKQVLVVGEKVYLTNGVGTIATAVVA